VLFQWFFTALSVRPTSSLEITAAGQGGGQQREQRQQWEH
jgi:hypothetical protein